MISIANRQIGPGQPCFVIAEAGVNHNGDPELARQLIDAAAAAGVDAVKFQTFKAEKLVTGAAKMADYQVRNTGEEASQKEMLKKLELAYAEHEALKDYAESKGLIFMSTPFDSEAIDFLWELGVEVFKAGSGDLTNLPYLQEMADCGLPMIISTGMATLDECREAVEAIHATENRELIVLHCTTNYPCPVEEVNLAAMRTLARELGVMVGYSDHTVGIEVPLLAVAMGARVIEKHFTLDRNMEGPDHRASLEPEELKEMMRRIREVETILGTGEKVPNPSEMNIMAVARKSIVAATDIRAGAEITAEMLTAKRPGSGMPPKLIPTLVGKRAQRNLSADTLVKPEDFA